jgi:hypothetical protein
MLLCMNVLQSQRLAPRLARGYRNTTKRFSKTTSNDNTKGNAEIDESNLKWTERKEAPKWLNKMAPTKGGTKLPTPKEAALIAIVAAAGYYAWFVEPPKRAAAVAEGQR